MITPWMALAVMQMQPNLGAQRTVARPPNLAIVALPGRKDRMIADGRALVVRAEQVNGSYAPAPGQPTKAELDGSIEQIKSDLDSMSAMGEMESLHLQMAMDRLSKMMSTLSNLLKKVSDTQESIVQNIK